ncbi:MAG: hypothetical protein Q8L98_06210 [Chlamydiales bacterium]|nr:hypothetical protein [Chlamydiales bacterium]
MKKLVILFLAMAISSGLEAKVIYSSADFCSKVFSALPQLILPREPVLLEKVSVQSCEIDLSFAAASGMILFKRSGVYKIIWSGWARSLFPWILGFSLDGVILVGNVYGNSCHHSTLEKFEGSIVLSINAGQVLRFVNASSHPIELIPGKSDPQSSLSSFTLSLCLFEPIYREQERIDRFY